MSQQRRINGKMQPLTRKHPESEFLGLNPSPSIKSQSKNLLNDSSFRTYVLTILPLLSALGFFGTWILASRNGTFAAIFPIIENPGSHLPGTTNELIKIYTGSKSLDQQLAVLVTFFAPAVGDQTLETVSLQKYSRFGIGQFAGVWCLMVMESLRNGNQRGLARILGFEMIGVVGMIMQNIAYTVTVPLWLFLHILLSPISQTAPNPQSLLVPTLDLSILPVSVIVGCIIPTILMTLSTATVGPEIHQYLIAFWQIFPITTVILHYLLRVAFSSSKPNTSENTAQATRRYLNTAKYIYSFVLFLCTLTHFPGFLLSLTPTSLLQALDPSQPHSTPGPNFTSIYVPYLPTFPLTHQISTLAEGVHVFLIWDLFVGSLAFVVWAAFLNQNVVSGRNVGWAATGAKIAGFTLLAGPIGAVSVLLLQRDMLVIAKQKKVKGGI